MYCTVRMEAPALIVPQLASTLPLYHIKICVIRTLHNRWLTHSNSLILLTLTDLMRGATAFVRSWFFLSNSINFLHFMKHEISLSCLLEVAAFTCLESGESIPRPPSLLLEKYFIIILLSIPKSPSWLFPSLLQTKFCMHFASLPWLPRASDVSFILTTSRGILTFRSLTTFIYVVPQR